MYYITPLKWRNLLLLLVNLVFYAWGEPRFVLFMAAAILQGYAAARLMERYPARRRRSPWQGGRYKFFTLGAGLSLYRPDGEGTAAPLPPFQ